MREIKFRGYCPKYNQWVYGATFSPIDNTLFYTVDGDEVNVNPETVGQYTGLKDRNGKEIYEGDILQTCIDAAITRERNITAEVYWDDLGMWATRKNEASCNPIGFAIELGCAVIGNIHDNPELLKGGNDDAN